MAEQNKIFVDDFMSEEDDVVPSQRPSNKISQKQLEENKSKLDIDALISRFIIKKEYFISHKNSDIRDEYEIEK